MCMLWNDVGVVAAEGHGTPMTHGVGLLKLWTLSTWVLRCTGNAQGREVVLQLCKGVRVGRVVRRQGVRSCHDQRVW